MLVVADSSPLIYLSRVGLLHVLPALFGEVVVPRTVWNEAVDRRPSAPGIELLRQASWLQVVDERSAVDLGLDPGETAAILEAEATGADLLLSTSVQVAKCHKSVASECAERSACSFKRVNLEYYPHSSPYSTRS